VDREYILRQIRLIQRQCEINAKRSEEIDNFLFGDLRNEIEKINRDKEDEEFTIYKFKLQNKE
jgi:hypothetical protein